jgi:hypothetical protein
MKGWGTELGGSVSWGRGLGVDLAGNMDETGNLEFAISPELTRGYGAEAHWFVTYSYPLYRSK